MGLSQGRIHSTESPNPTPGPLRETAGDRERQQERQSMTKRMTMGKIGIEVSTEED